MAQIYETFVVRQMRWSIHWLLVAVPMAVVLKAVGAGAPVLFFCAAVAIVPLVVLIVHGTEQLVARRSAQRDIR